MKLSPTKAKGWLDKILKALGSTNITLQKLTTVDKSMGGSNPSYGSAVTLTQGADVQPVTHEFKEMLEAGLVNVGDAVGYFRPSYVISGTTYTVERGDLITFNSEAWVVKSIIAKTVVDGTEVRRDVRLVKSVQS